MVNVHPEWCLWYSMPSYNTKKRQGNRSVDYDESSCASEQTRAAEKHMTELLDDICEVVDIRLEEWDMNKKLLEAIISSKNSSRKENLSVYEKYDSSYNLIKKLNVRLDSKYRWFTNITDHVKHKQK